MRSMWLSGILLFVNAAAMPSGGASALELGNDEFAAARAVTCVMVQDALGYLSPDAYDALLDQYLDPLGEEQGDVVYATAIGYFDGMMFGIPADDQRQINARLRDYNASRACTGLVASHLSL